MPNGLLNCQQHHADEIAVQIPTEERLIVALDVPSADEARALVDALGDTVHFYKIGLELAMSGEYFQLLDWLLERDKRVFADLKFYDIPATVAAAVRQIARSGASFLTVHGERAVTEAAAAEKGDRLRVLAVTVLTSVEQADLASVGIEMDVETLARRRAKQAIAAGCDGVIASGLEARRLREDLGSDVLIVTPGIRPADSSGGDDQRRIVTPTQAFANGADHIVVGRPIRASTSPREAARRIQTEIAGFFG
ncbi:MAG: orotidine-5'-phosphate decarboxylase [Gammaproteobacteria bacterium]|nr:orotidine-5'-phosphate decarboxylase [Gammaproteobacteria bacterium]